jgi:hypothetical protein
MIDLFYAKVARFVVWLAAPEKVTTCGAMAEPELCCLVIQAELQPEMAY